MLVSTTIVVLAIVLSSISYRAYLYILGIYSMRIIYFIYLTYTIPDRMSKSRICRYNCGIELGQFDEKENKYREAGVSGTLHTRERCESLKSQVPTKKVEPLTLEQIDARLRKVESMFPGPQK
jgi:hypothetical protein